MGLPDSSGSTGDREVVHARLISAAPEQLFKALAEPSRLTKWWGPKGFSSTFQTFEFRPGGKWTFVLHGPDGRDYPNENVFVEIEPSRRVVVEHLSEDHHFLLSITFEALENGTLVRWQQIFDTAAHKHQVAHVVLEANEQNLDRLEAEVRNVQGHRGV